MRLSREDYDQMRSWLAVVSRKTFPHVPEDQSAVAVLDTIAARSPAKARHGLEMAIGDLIELTSGWSAEQISALDQQLGASNLPTLTEVRARFSKDLERVLRRGRISSEAEYHAVRNAAEFAHDSAPFWQLIASYEGQQSP
jgi:hypothetical protein